MKGMKKLFYTFLTFLILALVVEVAILITTKAVGWDSGVSGRPWVVSVHVHILVLGALMFLILMLVEKNFHITEWKRFNAFYIVYLTGLGLVLCFILYKGFSQLLGAAVIRGLLEGGAAIAHTTMFVGLFFLAAGIKSVALPREERSSEPKEQ